VNLHASFLGLLQTEAKKAQGDGSVNGIPLLVHLQPKMSCKYSTRRVHHPTAGPFTPREYLKIIGIANES